MPSPPPPSRSDPASRALALVVLTACGPARAPTFASTDQWPDAPRSPDAIVTTPLAAPTVARARAETATTELALAPPLSDDDALALVGQLVDAMTREDAATALALFADRGAFIHPGAGVRAPIAAASALRERFRKLDYPALAGLPLVHEPATEVFRHTDLVASLPGRPPRPPEMAPGDVLLRARILTPRANAERLFGDEWLVIARPNGRRFQIQFVIEDFQIP